MDFDQEIGVALGWTLKISVEFVVSTSTDG